MSTTSGKRNLITLQPRVLHWARERSRLGVEDLARKIGVKPERVREWEQSGRISFSQVDKLAHHTHTPLGFLYLPEPVEDYLPISDFRTISDHPLDSQPSPDLLDTVKTMQRRQSWMRDEMIEEGNEPLDFVGSFAPEAHPNEVADSMRTTLGLETNWASAARTWTDAMRRLRSYIEATGVLVIINGIVANNTHRKLDPDEFQGFALVDEYAPLIFVNNADFKAAQMFTLVHELAHIWVGAEGVSSFEEALLPFPHEVERFCNEAAAEFLVPREELQLIWDEAQHAEEPYEFIARHFKVSTIVAARRSHDLELINRNDYFEFYRAWANDERRKTSEGEGGGDFWNNQHYRLGELFGAAVVRAVKEGRLLYRDAYSLTGLRGETFDKLIQQYGDKA